MGSFVVVRPAISSSPPPLGLTPLRYSVVRQRPCPIRISLKVSERDKHKMYETYQTTRHEQDDRNTCWDDLPPSEKLPPLRYTEIDTDGWEDFDVPVLYFYGGFMPYVSRWVFLSRLSPLSCCSPLTAHQGPTSMAAGFTERRLDRYSGPRNHFDVELGGPDGGSSSGWPVLVQNCE